MRWSFTLQFYILPYNNYCWHIFFHILFRHPVLGSQQLVALFGFVTNLVSQPQTLRLLHVSHAPAVTDYWHPCPWTAGEPERLSKSQSWGHFGARAVISGEMCLFCTVRGTSELGPGPAAIWPVSHNSQLLHSGMLFWPHRFVSLKRSLCVILCLLCWHISYFESDFVISSWHWTAHCRNWTGKKSYF